MGEIIRKHPRPSTESTFPTDSEMLVYLSPEPLAELIAYQIMTYGVYKTHATIRCALVDLARRKGNATAKGSSKLCSLVNSNTPIELDLVDALYVAFGRSDLFRLDYPELYAGGSVGTNV